MNFREHLSIDYVEFALQLYFVPALGISYDFGITVGEALVHCGTKIAPDFTRTNGSAKVGHINDIRDPVKDNIGNTKVYCK